MNTLFMGLVCIKLVRQIDAYLIGLEVAGEGRGPRSMQLGNLSCSLLILGLKNKCTFLVILGIF